MFLYFGRWSCNKRQIEWCTALWQSTQNIWAKAIFCWNLIFAPLQSEKKENIVGMERYSSHVTHCSFLTSASEWKFQGYFSCFSFFTEWMTQSITKDTQSTNRHDIQGITHYGICIQYYGCIGADNRIIKPASHSSYLWCIIEEIQVWKVRLGS